jgi:SAM-dependent methyltransferase
MQKTNYWENVFEGNNGYYMDLDNPSRLEIAKYIKIEDSVLELGCGGGALKSLLPSNSYLGIDYSETAIKLAKERYGNGFFEVLDTRDLSMFKDDQFDIVVMRHFLENQEDWRKTITEAFRIANKKVIINCRRPFVEYPSKILENPNDTWVWDINFSEFNLLCRQLSVNVSYGKINEEEFVIIGKHLDEIVFELDDFYDQNAGLDWLEALKCKFPNLKVTLFCIPSKCSIDFINTCKKRYGDWMSFAVHGWFHDTAHGTAQECNYWTTEDANKYLDIAEEMGVFEKIFRAPGWNYNIETYKVLIERGYIICEHLAHDRWPELGGKRYTTGHLMEVHGHVQNVNMNGLEELATTKCNFSDKSNFYFISEAPLDKYLPNRYQG